jgi:hypothetical protein
MTGRNSCPLCRREGVPTAAESTEEEETPQPRGNGGETSQPRGHGETLQPRVYTGETLQPRRYEG